MKRITNSDGTGYWSISGKDYSKAISRLAEIEDILGDDYDLENLKKWIQKYKIESNAPKSGDKVYYLNEDGSKEYGTIGAIFYNNRGNPESFSVNFQNNDFDEFFWHAWGSVVFPDDRG